MWAGSFTETLALDSVRLVSAGSTDALVASVTYAGAVRWARRFGGAGADAFRALGAVRASSGAQTDASAFIVGGSFTDRLDYGGINPLRAQGNNADIFFAQLTPTGTLGWIRTVGGAAGDDHVNSLAVRPDGSFCAAGSFFARATFFDREVVAQGADDAWVGCFEANGALRWLQTGGGPGADRWNGLAFGLDGELYVTGTFRGTAAFGARTLIARGGSDVMIARYSATGDLDWIRQAGGLTDDEGLGVGVTYSGSSQFGGSFAAVVVTGTFGSSGAIFEPTTFRSLGGRDVFVAFYSVEGGPGPTQSFGSAYDDVPAPVVLPFSNNEADYYLTGHVGTSAVGAETIFARDSSDVFGVVGSAISGQLRAYTAGGPQPDAATAAAFHDAPGNVRSVYTMGTFGGTAFFGPTTATVTPGNPDLFLARFQVQAFTVAETEGAVRPLTLGVPAPHPARTTVQVPVNGLHAPARLDVFDALGRLVHTAMLAPERPEARFSVRGWAPGVYVLRLTSGVEVQTRPLVVGR